MAGQNPADIFDAYFRRADLDGDGRISGSEAVSFFQASGLPNQVLAQVWMHADQSKSGFLGRAEFYNALKLVTVAQSKRELTPDMVKAALYGPVSAKIPPPQINLAALAAPQTNSNAAAPVPRSASSQNMAIRAPHVLANVSMNQQHFPSQQNQLMRPPQANPPATASLPQQHVAGQGMPGGGIVAVPRPPNSNISADWLGGRTGGPSGGVTSQLHNRGISPSTAQDSFGAITSGLAPSAQPTAQAPTGQMASTAPKAQDPAMLSNQLANKDSNALAVSGNGFASDSRFGDVFSTTPSQPRQDNLAVTSSSGSFPVSAVVPVSSGPPQPSIKSTPLDSLQTTFTQQPVGAQVQQNLSTGKQSQQVAAQSTTTSTSTGFPVGAGNSGSSQSELPWPRMTQSDVQKYSKVFVEVDTDRDGKITGEQARNLFLSWRLPREVLKQVWDLSDQDNDSMLSLREFCTALYLMERYREGRPLPPELPRTIIFDETLSSATGQPAPPYGNAGWGSAAGFQQPQDKTGMRPNTHAAAARPPRPPSFPQADGTVQPVKQKAKVPVLEKHLANQLSKEEQDSLDSKFQEATQADKKVEELEKEISDSREKIDFYRTKMQEIILYKSRCDNRLNEVMERVSSDKREVDSLVKKYEEKCKQVGDVASKLTIEEATFRDIQERKIGLYQAIVKMEEGGSADGGLQARADNIQSGIEELVKTVNDRCKKYGLRVKPTSLVELPFGWQPGIQEAAADWDENWDKFEDEGFTFVKELTLDLQNVIAPPKPKSSSAKKETTSTDDGLTASSSNLDAKPEKVPLPGTSEQVSENGLTHEQSEDGLSRSPSGSPGGPAGKSAIEYPSQEFSHIRKGVGADGSPHAKDAQSDHGDFGSVLSGGKGFDDRSWGNFDTHYDTDSVWSFDPDIAKDMGHERHDENSTFDATAFGLNPIRTQTPHTDNLFHGKSTFTFADSVPSTPAYNFGNSPRRFSEGSDEHSFDNFSRFDSFRTHDSGFHHSPRNSFARFDSFRSTRDSDLAHGFDSFSMHDSGFFQSPRHSLSRFDSTRSTQDSDFGHGFDSFSMHESGFFQSPHNSVARFDSFRSSKDPDEHHKDHDHSHVFPSFDDTDPFGSSGPFRTSLEGQTPRTGSDNWSAF